MFDIVIEKGKVADGEGKPLFAADVGVRGKKIAEIGNLKSASAKRRLDATGMIVAPGFIDMHTHSDFSLLAHGAADSQLLQGVTFEVVGNCGSSCAPVPPRALAAKNLTICRDKRTKIDWKSFAEYLQRLSRANPGVNVASFAGHNTLRQCVMRGEPRPATDDETAQMARLLDECLEQGAIGFTTGLEYNPGKAARAEEVVELCKVAARRSALYATHVRNRDLYYEMAFGEALAAARISGARLQISHVVPKFGAPQHAMRHTLEMIYWSRREGADVACDMIPHNWGPTLVSSVLPLWAFSGGVGQLLRRLADARMREKMRHNPMPIWLLVSSKRWRDIVLYNSGQNPELVGMRMADIAHKRGKKDVMDVIFDLLLEEGENMLNLTWAGRNFAEVDNRAVLVEDSCGVISDGVTTTKPEQAWSPSVCGWSARFLQRYVREAKLMTLAEGVRRLTGLPAQRLGLAGRGRIAKRCFADIVVFSYNSLRDRSTLKNPGRAPVGIEHVLVNGKVAVFQRKRTGENAGMVVGGKSGGER